MDTRTVLLDQLDWIEACGRLTLWLPFPPSVNHYWRRVGNKTILSREGREYRELVAERCAALRGTFGRALIQVTINAIFPDHRRRDVDNLAKACLDALGHCGVYEDDSQIKKLTIEHVGTDKPGFIRVTIIRRETQEA